jgi:L-fuconate dehydratase
MFIEPANDLRITAVKVLDIRFPTSDELDGSDAMHVDPDYSSAYVILETDGQHQGHGLTFTIGRGTEIVCAACRSLSEGLVGRSMSDIVTNFLEFHRSLTNDSQSRWIGPEKGVIHLATAAIVNAIWDLWGKIENKPVWPLVCELEPRQILELTELRYVTDVLTRDRALDILEQQAPFREQRIAELRKDGYPAYTTSAGWLGYSDEKIRELCLQGIAEGWNHFKIKVGQDIEDDRRRCRIVRETIGPDRHLMTDANQKWEVGEAIEWMKQLVEFKPLWIEEPTSPDDILGHKAVADALRPLGIGVATGEMCQNRIIFKQLMAANALDFCQYDSCRLASVNEILAVLLMAAELNVPCCPHAGGVGLCQYVNHLVMIDYVCIAGTHEGRVAEYVSHLHEHFADPWRQKAGAYLLPEASGYGITMKPDSLHRFAHPHGSVWVERAAK